MKYAKNSNSLSNVTSLKKKKNSTQSNQKFITGPDKIKI